MLFVLFLIFTPIFLHPQTIQWDEKWELSTNQSNWTEVSDLPSNLHSYLEEPGMDEIFLRTKFYLDSPFPPSKPLAIRLGIILDRDKFYLNDFIVGQTGVWDSTKPQAYDKIRIYTLPSHLLKFGENHIQVHIKKYFPDEIGPAQDKIQMGFLEDLLKEFYYEEMVNMGFLVFYLAVSLYFLFLFFRRKEWEYAFFSLFTLNLILYQFFRTQTKFLLPMEFWLLKKWEYLLLPSLIPFMAHFIRTYFQFPYLKVLKGLDFGSLVVFLGFLFENEVIELDRMNRNLLQPLWLLYTIHSLYLIILKIREKNQDALLLLSGILGIVLAAVIDIFSARFVWNIPRISGYAFLTNVLFQALLLANKFVRLNQQVEELNENLEKKVELRTQELQKSLQEIQVIKNHQDGDYFLTTLLLKPLHKNPMVSQEHPIQILTQQKKKFQFRGKELEIGGDLSMVEEIELMDEKYIFFVNSDAMGKSIQGAGGALVCGVLIKSILSRQKSEYFKNRYPEKWLKDYFLDLQSAFETFEGSMFVSMVSGLIHKESGFVYYFNAEHPDMVVFNKVSQFLNNPSAQIRKIGIPENEKNFQVSTYKSKPGDILVLGTDGRDDIDLSMGREKVMNEDETLFLQIVEEAGGRLENILAQIQSKGCLTDDLSLVSIPIPNPNSGSQPKKKNQMVYGLLRYTQMKIQQGNFARATKALQKIQNLDPENPRISAIQGRIHWILKNYELALGYFYQAQKSNPSDEVSIFSCAKCYQKLNRLKEARDMAERLRLRNPANLQVVRFLKTLSLSNLQNLEKAA